MDLSGNVVMLYILHFAVMYNLQSNMCACTYIDTETDPGQVDEVASHTP